MTDEKKKMTKAEAGKLGHEARLKNDPNHDTFRLGGQKGGQTNKDDGMNFSKIGKKGGDKTKKVKGLAFYSDIGKIGGKTPRKKD